MSIRPHARRLWGLPTLFALLLVLVVAAPPAQAGPQTLHLRGVSVLQAWTADGHCFNSSMHFFVDRRTAVFERHFNGCGPPEEGGGTCVELGQGKPSLFQVKGETIRLVGTMPTRISCVGRDPFVSQHNFSNTFVVPRTITQIGRLSGSVVGGVPFVGAGQLRSATTHFEDSEGWSHQQLAVVKGMIRVHN